jgi:hypothetical protein
MADTGIELAPAKVVESAWLDQATWSETANRLKSELTTWRYRAAGAGIIGAFLEVLAGTLAVLGDTWWGLRSVLALTGAIILAVVPYVVKNKTSKDNVRAWVRARSVSEALKETIYRYLVGVPPFGSGSSPSDLVRRCQTLKDKVQDLYPYAASVQPKKTERPLTLSIDGYVENRVNDQINRYYHPKGRQNADAARKLHDLEFYLGLLAVIIGAIAGAATAYKLPELAALSPWVAVVTTAGAAVTAHLAASRYDYAAMTYFSTADRLKGLRDEWLSDPNRYESTRVIKFVDDCENAISTENEAWLAEWTREETQS